jgi:hypothetical protein
MIPPAQSLPPELFSQIDAIANKKSLLFAQPKKAQAPLNAASLAKET